MKDANESLYKNITLNDVQLAAAYYPILIDLAKHKHCLTYGGAHETILVFPTTLPSNEDVMPRQ